MNVPRGTEISLKDRYKCHEFYHELEPHVQTVYKRLLASRIKPEDAATIRAHLQCECPCFHSRDCALYFTDDYDIYLAERRTIELDFTTISGAVLVHSPSANQLPISAAYFIGEFTRDGAAHTISTAVGTCPNCEDDVGPGNPILDNRLLRQTPKHALWIQGLKHVTHMCFTEAMRYIFWRQSDLQELVDILDLRGWRVDDPPRSAIIRNREPLISFGDLDVYIHRNVTHYTDSEGHRYQLARGEPCWPALINEHIEFFLMTSAFSVVDTMRAYRRDRGNMEEPTTRQDVVDRYEEEYRGLCQGDRK